MENYVQTALNDREQNQAVPFAVFSLKTGLIVGSTRFGNLKYWKWSPPQGLQREHTTPDVAEIGWTWLSASSQRTPINTEMKYLLLRYAFEAWKVHRVTLKTDSRNIQSRKAIERIGAHFDGILRADMPGVDGNIRDSAYYSILMHEWPEIQDRLKMLMAR